MILALTLGVMLAQAPDSPLKEEVGLQVEHVEAAIKADRTEALGPGCWLPVDDCITLARRQYELRTGLQRCEAERERASVASARGWSTWVVLAAMAAGVGFGAWLTVRIGPK